VVYVSAEIPAPGVVRHNGRGDLVVGAVAGSAGADIAALAAALVEAEIPVRISGNIVGELWAKLLLNCAYNAVSALGRARYGPMMAMPEVRRVVSEAVTEILAVARARGVDIAMDKPVETVLAFADAMPGAMSSTAQDLLRGRTTEIEHLNGTIVREADARGIPVPVNRTLYALVRLAERAPGSGAACDPPSTR
jgi:2-dehydropantoate 2-reductase